MSTDTTDPTRPHVEAQGAEDQGTDIAPDMRPRSARRTRKGLLRRLPRRVTLTAAAVLVPVLVWFGISVGGVLMAPGTDTVPARLAGWARQHHLGWAVTQAEKVQYQFTKPKTGGTVAGGIPTLPVEEVGDVATAPTSPPTGASAVPAPAGTPSATTSPTQTATQASVSTPTVTGKAQPPALRPLANGTLAGEGTWRPLMSVRGKTAASVAMLRPDNQHTSYLVSVVWMDPTLLKFELNQGYQVPGGKQVAPNQIPNAKRDLIRATFNSGFQMVDANGGYWQNGTTIYPLRKGAASMVLGKDGSLTLKAWPGGAPPAGTAAVRQNLSMIIDRGKVSPDVDNSNTRTWGATVGNAAYVWRSAVGTRKDGSVVVVVGPAMDIRSLTNVLVRAGAYNAMELDINQDWTNYIVYSHPASGGPVPHHVAPGSVPNKWRYLQPSTRDFVSVYAR